MIAVPREVQISNFDLPVAGEIYFFDVPKNTCHFTIIARNKSKLQISYNDLHEYITIPAGCGYYENSTIFNGTISLISSKDNEVAEIVCWYGSNQ